MDHISLPLTKLKPKLLAGVPVEEAACLAWPLVCGSAVAVRTQAASFRDGTLTIIVPDHPWKSQLLSLSPAYIRALCEISPVPISRLEFKIEADDVASLVPRQRS